ncbi:MAG TPA: hypothetical protein ENN31_00265 [Candidatus Vogelbacteria bacterium]|nr:hypothetical protein [Candidatus Vogelbacteria bacterium]
MNNYKIYIGVVVVLVIGALGVYFLPKIISDQGSYLAGESYFSAKVVDMMKKEKPLECRTQMENEESLIEAVYYFDNKNERIRVDTEVVAKGGGVNINTTSIIRDGWNYFWDNLTNKDGMKIKVEDYQNPEEVDYGVDVDEKFDFKCKSWRVDSSKFDLPADKSFVDISGLLSSFEDFSTSPSSDYSSSDLSTDIDTGNFNSCDFCNMIPAGPERDDCLSSC